MKSYRKIWQKHYQLSIPTGWHVHHVDGNHENNNPANLECVSPLTHWCIHFLQGDTIALDGKFIQGANTGGGRFSKGTSRNAGDKNTMFGRRGTQVPFFGRKHSEDTRKLMSVQWQDKRSKIACEHCGVIASKPMHDRWHGQRCRNRKAA